MTSPESRYPLIWLEYTLSDLLCGIDRYDWLQIAFENDTEDLDWHGWKLEDLATAIQEHKHAFRRFKKAIFLYIGDFDARDAFVDELGDLLATLPKLGKLNFRECPYDDDEALNAGKVISGLLQHPKLMTKIRSLVLECPLLQIFRQTAHLNNLRKLKVYCRWEEDCNSDSIPDSILFLAQAIEKLPKLEAIELGDFRSEILQPVIDVLGKKTSIKEARAIDDNFPAGRNILLGEQYEGTQTFPRIHEALKEHNLPDDFQFIPEHGLGAWLGAMASVSDRFDCFHYLLSTIPPHFLLEHVITEEPAKPQHLWDFSFLQKLRKALLPRSKKPVKPVFPIGDTLLQEKGFQLWNKMSSDPLDSDTTMGKKWSQGLALLTCSTLEEVSLLDCSHLLPEEVKALLSHLFPSLEESLRYTHVDPLDMPLTVRILQAFLAGQCLAAVAPATRIWYRGDARWNHLRAEDRSQFGFSPRPKPPPTVTFSEQTAESQEVLSDSSSSLSDSSSSSSSSAAGKRKGTLKEEKAKRKRTS